MADRKVFSDSIIPIPQEQGLAPNGLVVQAEGVPDTKEIMTIQFALSISKEAQAELEAKVARGEVVSAKELQTSYAANSSDLDALTGWLKGEGFKIVQITPDRTSVYAQASVAQIKKSLMVTMARVTKGGLTYTAARDAPSLPADVGRGVHAIIGLQPFRQMNKRLKKPLPGNGNRARLHGKTHTAAGPSPNIENAPPYLVKELLKAYNADGLSVTGAGQTIAILIDTVPDDGDLRAFWQHNGLPDMLGQIEKINVKGDALPASEGEETLDVSWASGVAPGAK